MQQPTLGSSSPKPTTLQFANVNTERAQAAAAAQTAAITALFARLDPDHLPAHKLTQLAGSSLSVPVVPARSRSWLGSGRAPLGARTSHRRGERPTPWRRRTCGGTPRNARGPRPPTWHHNDRM
jgi:hypothetical protein